MSATKNAEAMTPAQGEFKSKVAPSEPMTTKGHAPGVLVGKDRIPEFHAEAHPPGTAPPSRSFQPDQATQTSIATDDKEIATGTNASDTLPGATSADVHRGFGHPGSGMTSSELHGAQKPFRAGLEGVGANAIDPQHKHLQDREHPVTHRGVANDPANYPAAEDRPTATAEEVASERA